MLLDEVSNQINKLIVGQPTNKSKFCEHIEKVIRKAEGYGQYLRAEWQRAKEAGLTQYDKNRDKEKRFWWTAYANDWTWGKCVYFVDDECLSVQFYLEGKPEPDPLDYLCSMVWGSVGQIYYERIEPSDYQFVLLAIIHDAQNWQAGRERIYFNKLGKETLSDRLCGVVWEHLEKFRQDPYQFKDVQQTIETALLAVKAELAKEKQEQGTGTKPDLSSIKPAEKKPNAPPAKDEEQEDVIVPKPPESLQKLLWMLKYGKKHWKLLLLAAFIMFIWFVIQFVF